MLSGVAATFIDSSVIYPRLMDPRSPRWSARSPAPPISPARPGAFQRAFLVHHHGQHLHQEAGRLVFPAVGHFQAHAEEVALKGVLPPRASVWQDAEFTKAYQPDFIDAMNVTMKTAVCLPSGTKAGLSIMGLLDLQTRKVQEVLLGQKEAKPAMDELAAEYNKVIQGQK